MAKQDQFSIIYFENGIKKQQQSNSCINDAQYSVLN